MVVAAVGRVMGTVAAGVAIDRVARGIADAKATAAPNPLSGQGAALHGSGDQRLHQLAENIAPAPNANAIRDAYQAQLTRRASVLRDAQVVAGNPAEAGRQLAQGARSLVNDLQVAHGAVNVATGQARIEQKDGAYVAQAGVRKGLNKISEHLSNLNLVDAYRGVRDAVKGTAEATYVAGTVSEKGMQEMAGAVRSRSAHEVSTAAAGLVMTRGAAAALAAIPHPAAKVAGAVLTVTGSLATGAQLSKALHRMAGGDQTKEGAMAAAAEVLREKSGWRAAHRTGPAAAPSQAATDPSLLKNLTGSGVRPLPTLERAVVGAGVAAEVAARMAAGELQLADVTQQPGMAPEDSPGASLQRMREDEKTGT